MQTIVFIMKEKMFAECLKEYFEDKGAYVCVAEEQYENAECCINLYQADIVVLELPKEEMKMNNFFRLCENLRLCRRELKLLVLCSDMDEEERRLLIEAKRRKTVDDFIDSNLSLRYMYSKLRAL